MLFRSEERRRVVAEINDVSPKYSYFAPLAVSVSRVLPVLTRLSPHATGTGRASGSVLRAAVPFDNTAAFCGDGRRVKVGAAQREQRERVWAAELPQHVHVDVRAPQARKTPRGGRGGTEACRATAAAFGLQWGVLEAQRRPAGETAGRWGGDTEAGRSYLGWSVE